MKTTIKTSIKGNENLTVKDDIDAVYTQLINKNSFVMLAAIDYNNNESQVIIRKGTIKLVK